MGYLTYLLFFFSLSAWAQVQVQVLDPAVDTRSLESKGYKVTREEKVFSALPNKEDRDSLLKSIPDTKNWDELQKDIFYMDLRSKTLSQLKRKYPAISEDLLQKLKDKRG